MKYINPIIWKILAAVRLDSSVKLLIRSALLEDGWFRSYRTQQAVDKNGKAIPWCTYPFIHFLKPRLKSEFRVFEYGCGNSTLWYAERVKEIISVEHDHSWFQKIKDKLPENAAIVYKDLEEGYVEEVSRHGLFDIIIIDGQKRPECAPWALQALKPDGVIIWDNSNREDFSTGSRVFTDNDFREIYFSGMSPICTFCSRTSVLYRNNNCLAI